LHELKKPHLPASPVLYGMLESGTDVKMFKNIFAEKFGEKIGVFD
jgi:hypothetical protein